ncbi:SDR family oxidoreductase [Saccharicrinis sp. 156]|uniref:SDR family oxidoreductase n=1 Tax=Saccharicrinis sp. 156 TaxID=3417574 RepID=UPI003D32F21D
MNINKVVIAGSTGYLGKYMVKESIQRGLPTIAVARNTNKLSEVNSPNLLKLRVDFNKPTTISSALVGVDTVISSLGITRQKDGLTYMDVDYQANANLLKEAKKAGVRKFIYISVLNGQNMRQLKICEAKERFVDELKASGLEYSIIRPTGFFSDMKDFLDMAAKGKVYLFGDGKKQMNPIHGEDLAKVCLDAVETDKQEIEVGGPEVLSHRQIAQIALQAYNKPINIKHLPDWIRRFVIQVMRIFTTSKTYGSIEFFLTAMENDMVGISYGKHKLNDFFKSQISSLPHTKR